jgi:hypothetical protein
VSGAGLATAKGDVYNLFGIAEFPGQYASVGAGATVIKGKVAQTFENHKGVKIILSSTPYRLNLNIGPEGFNIEMEQTLYPDAGTGRLTSHRPYAGRRPESVGGDDGF